MTTPRRATWHAYRAQRRRAAVRLAAQYLASVALIALFVATSLSVLWLVVMGIVVVYDGLGSLYY